MNPKLEELIEQAMKLPVENRRRLVRLLIDSLASNEVRDSGVGYGDSDWLSKTLLPREIGMTSVTFVLPDELAKRAQAAGLLSEARLAELISGALKEQGIEMPSESTAPGQRRIVRRNNRLVVESLPGEQPITDADVRRLLGKLEW